MGPKRGVRLLLTVAVTMNVCGNFCLGLGMHQIGQTVTASVEPYLRALLNPWVAGGVIMLVVWLVSQLSLLSRADLSYVMPMTASAYILTAILGQVLLNETVSLPRWAGIALIAAGVMVVGRTAPHTTGAPAGVHPPAVVYPLEEDDEVGTGPGDRGGEHGR